ncbi:MAG: outer membrane protein transport protein [Myxococcales bacterium]|nr:outer membrane protein transport protein [Myxococcales bacterium]
MSARTIMLAMVIALASGSAARADLASHFGLNPRTMGLAGAYTGVADDVTALYYNPAGLVQLKGMTAAAGILFGAPLLNEDGARLDMRRETSWYLHVGIPFTGKLKDHLALGFSLNIPWGSLFSARVYRKQDPYFVLYDGSVDLLQLRVGAAFRIPWKPLSFLSFGASIQVLASVVGTIGFYAPFQRGEKTNDFDSDQRLEANLDLDVPTEGFVTVGVMARIGEHFRVGASYRGRQFIGVEIPVKLNTRLALAGNSAINLPVDATAILRAKYYPQQVSLGGSFRSKRWLVALDLTWVNYADYQVPFARIDLDIERLIRDPGVLIFLGPDATLLAPRAPKIEFSNMIVPRLGVEYTALDWLIVRGGYFYEHSPLKTTDFPIYDTDKHSFSLGARATFLKPLGLLPGRLNIDVSLTDIVYIGRDILGSRASGHVLGLFTGVEITLL